jgi:Ca2+-binding RTX toxin-like protein
MGGDGIDSLTLDYYGSQFAASITFDIIGNGTGTTSSLSIEEFSFRGGNNNDFINDSTAIYKVSLEGSDGNDTLLSGSAADNIYGNAGNDFLDGGGGNDYITDREGANTINGGSGNDTITSGGLGSKIDGGTGTDLLLIDYSSVNYSVIIDSNNSVSTTTLSIQNIESSLFHGGNANDYVDASAINDFNGLYGGAGNDTLIGGNSYDRIYGNAGNDLLFGSGGGDLIDDSEGFNTINGGEGNDTIIAGIGNTVNGGSDDDNITTGINSTINGDSGNDYIHDIQGGSTVNGGEGSDLIAVGINSNINGGSGDDTIITNIYSTIDGGNGINILYLDYSNIAANITFDNSGNATGTNTIRNIEKLDFDGSSANDYLNASATTIASLLKGFDGNDTLLGGSANDTISGFAGNDFLDGGAGDDSISDITGINTINGGAGNDFITTIIGSNVDGGAGVDRLYMYYDPIVNSVNLTFDANNNSTGTSIIKGIEYFTLTCTNQKDYINASATSSANNFSGYYGDDTILSGSGNDNLNGDEGNDYLNAGAGNDYLNGGAGNDVLDGSSDNNGLDTFAGGYGDDVYGIYNSATVIIEYAGAGTDTVWTAVNYTLAANVENMYLVGSVTGVGNASDNILSGYGVGDNTIYGLAGNDILYGGLGNDYLNGGVGNDFLDGGVGNDILDGSGDSAGLDTFVGGAGDDVYGVYKSSTIVVEDAGNVGGNDTVWTAVNYTLAANVENMYLVGALTGNGNASNNFIVGYGADNHIINGLGGDDGLYGGAGSDTLDGGDGIDNLFGGVGNDTFILNKNSADNILDFEFGSDRLQISASAFGGGLVTNTSLLSTQLLIGAGISTANDLAQRLIYNSSNGDLFFDADGNATTSMAIKIGNLGGNNNLGVNSFSIV